MVLLTVVVLLTVMVVAGAVDVTRVVLGVMARQEQALEMREAGYLEAQAGAGGLSVLRLSSSAPQSWVGERSRMKKGGGTVNVLVVVRVEVVVVALVIVVVVVLRIGEIGC